MFRIYIKEEEESIGKKNSCQNCQDVIRDEMDDKILNNTLHFDLITNYY